MQRLLILAFCLSNLLVASDAALERALRSLPPGSAASVCLLELDAGLPVVSHQEDRPTRLASVTKLFVSAAALLQLGPDHPMTTRIYALGPITAGRIPGLLIRGSGSPCLDEHFSDRQPERILQGWIEQLQAAGVTSIDGPVLVDGSLFVGPQRPPTYPQDHRNLQQWYSAPASAFAWLDNCIEVQVRPGTVGQAAEVHIRPDSPRITITNKTTTVAAVSKPKLLVSRAHHANHVIVSGSYASPTAWFPMAIHADADLLHGDHFITMLERSGISVTPTMSERGRLADQAQPLLLVEHHDRLGPALTILNQRSQNFYGEQILRLIATERGLHGSIDQGCSAVTGCLQEAGFDLGQISLLDGSGLSYDNRASARAVCELLRGMAGQQDGPFYRSTLKDMAVGSVTCKVKTGTLSVARCLAGYFDHGGRSFAFAILIERVEQKGAWLNKAKDACNRILATLIDIAAR